MTSTLLPVSPSTLSPAHSGKTVKALQALALSTILGLGGANATAAILPQQAQPVDPNQPVAEQVEQPGTKVEDDCGCGWPLLVADGALALYLLRRLLTSRNSQEDAQEDKLA